MLTRHWGVPLATAMTLIVACLITSSKKPLSADEVLSYYVISDPSFTHMLQATGDTISTAPPAYFAFAWVWGKVFGLSHTSLRLSSCLAFCASLLVVHGCLARTYSVRAANLGTAFVFCLSHWILFQNAEIRFYGLFLLVTALTLELYQKYRLIESPRVCYWLLNALAYAAAAWTHYFGLCFSGMLLLAAVVRDWRDRRWRLSYYTSAVAGWIAFVPWIPCLLRHKQMTTHVLWVPKPGLRALLDVYSAGMGSIGFFFLALFGTAILARRSCSGNGHDMGRSPSADSAVRHQDSLRFAAGAFFLVPVIVWCLSRLSFSLFVDRYFLPITLAWAIVIADLSASLPIHPSYGQNGPATTPRKARQLSAACSLGLLMALLLTFPVGYAIHCTPPGSLDRQIVALGFRDLPIAVESAHDFLEQAHNSRNGGRYVFMLDEAATTDPSDARDAANQFQILSALKTHYSTVKAIPSADFLATYREFLLLDQKKYRWSERALPVAGYQRQVLARFSDRSVVHVLRVDSTNSEATAQRASSAAITAKP
jgi:hypothetical protein